MRHFLYALAALILTVPAFAESKPVVIKVHGQDALTLSAPADAKITTEGEKTSIVAGSVQVYLWSLPKAQKVDEAVPQAGETIKSEFVNFALKSTEALTVAGHEAKHLKGTGNEADDNDPGAAEVVIFTDGKHVYAACVHGEKDHAAQQRAEFLKVLASIKPS